MSPRLFSLTHGMNGLEFGYLIVLISLLIALRQGRASDSALWWSPVTALPVMIVSGIVVSIATPLWGALGVDRHGVLQVICGTLMTAATGYYAGRLIAIRKRSQ